MTLDDERINDAAKTHAKATALIALAKKQADDARDVLELAWRERQADFRFQSGRSWRAKYGTVAVTVTVPKSADLPPRFDGSRTEEALTALMKKFNTHFDLFKATWTFDPERALAIMNDPNVPAAFKQDVATLLDEYMLPAEEGKELAPRITSKQEKR